MKITAIEIGRFGVWQQFALRVPLRGISVFYGPNEAGKTTLLRFIRNVLYGYEPFGVNAPADPSQPAGWEGSLRVERQGRPYEIRRVSDRGTRGLVSVIGTDRAEPAESLLGELLDHSDEALFKNVFAVSLEELQELSVLHGDEVARHIYGMTIGPRGRKLLDAGEVLDGRAKALFDPSSSSGTLLNLLEREQAKRDELAAHCDAREEHAALCEQRRTIENRIESLRRKRTDLQRQMGAHQLLEHVWPLWNQVRECSRDLDSIPEVIGFPVDGLKRLSRLEADLQSATNDRQQLAGELKSLGEKLKTFRMQRERWRHAQALTGYVEQSDWLADVLQRRAAAENRAERLKVDLDRLLGDLGKDWTPARLTSGDSGLGAHRRILSAADRYRAALHRRRLLLHDEKRIKRSVRTKTLLLDEQIKTLGGRSLDETIAAQRAHLHDLEKLTTLRLRKRELTQRREAILADARQFGPQATTPRWTTAFLGLLSIVGAIVFLVGAYRGLLSSDGLAGASLALSGITGLGVAWGLRRHSEAQSHETGHRRASRLADVEAELGRIQAAIDRQTGATSVEPNAVSDSGDDGRPEADLLRDGLRKLAELERWSQVQNLIQSRRRRLSELRSRFQAAQRAVSAERQNWCTVLKEQGLAETVRISEALETWHRVWEGRERARSWQVAIDETKDLERWTQSFIARMESAALRAGQRGLEGRPPLLVLASWNAEINGIESAREDFRRTRHELRACRKKARHADRRLRRVRAQLSGLFVKGGADDRAEFLERAEWDARRNECESLLKIANEELRAASESEPELAIVEDDLEQFDPDLNQERMASAAKELEQVDRDRQAAFEELGRIKQTLAVLESDREATRLRFATAQMRHAVKRAAEEWFGIRMAQEALDRMRSEFERSCQPAVLASASKYFSRLTRGRYGNVWTPLGRRELRIDDDRGLTFGVEQLSRGTREQLFLAVRMAAVRELAKEGVELPMVLDDVLVNFDQSRSEAVIDSLLEFADENQQVLFFTCHLHLARLFEQRGVDPIWLPAHDAAQEGRRAG